ncbi:response regulator transcription factor [Sulfurimonas lithotrophica]|uniref:Response regulator transcription factor n=1 Tax=Sulfurimonas lithotrophica TaxID=2590022 RepID=A0A5P8P3M6_9BACT|nr:response regulator transcription factor [Sulfurimonas lithotrophica]QFR50211.1 response regulator transcription factor [Sulfurimonas lithotrophica]
MTRDNISIIVVEDDDNVREELVEILSSLFKHVAEAKDGCEGLEYIQKYKPDVLISDIRMPCLDGLDMLSEVKKAHKDIVTIFASAFSEKSYLLDAINMQANGFLLKPINVEELIEKIKESVSIEDDANNDVLDVLSKREYEVMCDIARGIKPAQIAEKYGVKPKTISTYRRRILEKLSLVSNSDIVKYAIEKKCI